jgi:hypothetical protein
MSTGVIDHGSSSGGRWLQSRRWRISLGVAVVEGIAVALAAGLSRWTVIGLALVAVALYAFAGRNTRWRFGHQLSWIFAMSQVLAVVVTILSFLFLWVALLAVGIFAVVALVVLFTDRR